MKYLSILTLIFLCLACKEQNTLPPAIDITTAEDSTRLYVGQKLPLEQKLTTIALGSCNKHYEDQEVWPIISTHSPQLWLWLGDNIYSDTEDMEEHKAAYLQQKHNKKYKKFRQKTPVIGIWDDHDYGTNDGDKNYSKKDESKALMMDFLDVPKTATLRTQTGAFQSYVFGETGKKVKFILLDARYFRDELEKNPSGETRYLLNPAGDILGETQWKWLSEELEKNDAQIHIIACGIQFIPEEQIFEKWANFPTARKRFFDLLTAKKPSNVLLLSGDRHITEYSEMEIEGFSYPIPELTCSALNNAYTDYTGEFNSHRIGEVVFERNFGLLKIDWENNTPDLTIEIHNMSNNLVLKQVVPWE